MEVVASWQDVLNGSLEFMGGLFIILSIRRTLLDRKVRGVSWLATGFFMVWGYWNLYYYPHLDQWWSFAGGVLIVVMNTVWTSLLVWFVIKERMTVAVEYDFGPIQSYEEIYKGNKNENGE